jgi:hypothetical protein
MTESSENSRSEGRLLGPHADRPVLPCIVDPTSEIIGVAPSKSCCRCGQTKPVIDFYTKGSRTDSACKSCVKAKKQKVRSKLAVGIHAERLQQIADLIEPYEMSKLDGYYTRLREITERCELRLKEQENQP